MKSDQGQKISVNQLFYEVQGLRSKLYNAKQLARNTGDEHFDLIADATAVELAERLKELRELQRP